MEFLTSEIFLIFFANSIDISNDGSINLSSHDNLASILEFLIACVASDSERPLTIKRSR
jgi:hypothetical protein